MEMVEETLTKKQKQMLVMEYLDLVDGHKNLVDLTVCQLNQKNLMEMVSRIQLMNLSRSTLQDDGIFPCGCLALKEVIKDLKDIDWNECHITSLSTQNAANSASSSAVLVTEPKKVGAATSVSNTGTASSTGTVSVKKPKKNARVAASVTTAGTASSAGTNSAVSLKNPSGTSVAAGSTTVRARGLFPGLCLKRGEDNIVVVI
ncbi:unnamed protein product [Fraxinus pennsylvanica]|uniref:Uncharacterized protein n=1 Tax=Fraxinus pennsylvanica TaxID=56036 RepID=A0AAD1ZVK0_9LAMI|nr:unnamed protein product [Fraxinus pennsylvanica]